jgi:hypothetical protein
VTAQCFREDRNMIEEAEAMEMMYQKRMVSFPLEAPEERV